MTVLSVEDEAVLCSWFAGDTPNQQSFAVQALELVTADKTEQQARQQTTLSEAQKKAGEKQGTMACIGCLVVVLFVVIVYQVVQYSAGAYDPVQQANRRTQEQGSPAMVSKFGPRPEASAWDGVAKEVGDWFKVNLKDPASLDVIEVSEISEHEAGWLQRVKYRSKNSFGGYSVETRGFVMSRGSVVIDILME